MLLKAYVVDEIDSSYTGKRGKVSQRSLILSDHSDQRRLNQMLEVALTEDQTKAFSGKLQGKVLNVQILEFGQNMFGGRVRIQRAEIDFGGSVAKAT